MNWEALGALSEFVGAVGVILTLLYLSLQIRGNTRATDQQGLRDANQYMTEVHKLMVQEPELVEINLRGLESYLELDSIERERFHYLKTMDALGISGVLSTRGNEDGSLPSMQKIIERRMAKRGYREWWVERGQYVVAPDYFDRFNDCLRSAQKDE